MRSETDKAGWGSPSGFVCSREKNAGKPEEAYIRKLCKETRKIWWIPLTVEVRNVSL